MFKLNISEEKLPLKAAIFLMITIIVSAVLLSGCIGGKEKVESGDTVKVEYTGKHTNGTVFDSSEGRSPLEFVAGKSQMIKGFDDAVIGMEVGDKKTVTIPPEDAYGEVNEELIIEVDRKEIEVSPGQALKVGELVSTGFLNGKIIEVGDEKVKIDFNHRLAGETLTFDIELVEIKKPEKGS